MVCLAIFPPHPPVFPLGSRVGNPKVSGYQQPWAGNKHQKRGPERGPGCSLLFCLEGWSHVMLVAPWGAGQTQSFPGASLPLSPHLLQHVLFAFVFPTGQRTDCSLAR